MWSDTRITSGMSCSTMRMPSPRPDSSVRSVAEVPGLVLVEAGRRLVEQQYPGTRREGPAQLHQAGLAGRELRGLDIGEWGQPEPFDDEVDLRLEVEPLGPLQELGAGRGGAGPPLADLTADQHVLAHRERSEHLEALEGASDSPTAPGGGCRSW